MATVDTSKILKQLRDKQKSTIPQKQTKWGQNAIEADAKNKAELEARAKAEQEAKAKAAQEAKAKAEQEADAKKQESLKLGTGGSSFVSSFGKRNSTVPEKNAVEKLADTRRKNADKSALAAAQAEKKRAEDTARYNALQAARPFLSQTEYEQLYNAEFTVNASKENQEKNAALKQELLAKVEQEKLKKTPEELRRIDQKLIDKRAPSYSTFYLDPNYQKDDAVGTQYKLPDGNFILKTQNGWANIGKQFTAADNAPFYTADKAPVFADGTATVDKTSTIAANFWENPDYQKDDPVGQKYSLPDGRAIIKGEKGWSVEPTKKFTLPDGTVATVKSTSPLVNPTDPWSGSFDVDKLGSIVYTDKGNFVSYSKGFLDGKDNVIRKDGVTTVMSPRLFNENSKQSFNGSDDFEGNVLVPYKGGYTLTKSYYDNAEGNSWKTLDNDLVGKTIQMPDGSFQTVTSITQSDSKTPRYGAGYAGAAIFNTVDGTGANSRFAYYDESFLKGERKGGDGRNGWYLRSDYLENNKDRASAVDFSGIGKDLGSTLGSKGIFVPYTGTSTIVNAYEYWAGKKGGLFGGGFLGEIVSDFTGLLNNPVVQLGVSAFVPGGAAIVAGYNAGNALANGGIEAAIKAGAVGLVAGQAGSLASGAVGSVGNSIVDTALKGAVQGATSGLVGSALTGGDLGKGIVSGVIGGTAGGLASGIVNQVFPSVPADTIDGTVEFEPEAEIAGGAGAGLPNNVGDLNLGLGSLIGNTNISPIGINTGNFKPDVIDPLNPNLNNLGGSFGSDPKLLDTNAMTPKLGSDNGIGITIPLFNSDGTQQGFQGTGGSVGTQFNTPLGNPNSFVNNPVVTGQPLVNNGGVNPTPDFNSSLTDLANNNIGTGTQQPTNNVTPQPVGQQNNANDFLKNVSKDVLANLFKGLLAGGVKNTLTQPIGTGQNTGANMAADYSGLIGNLLGQNTQINRLQDTGNQIAGNYNAAAQELNKPFTPFNITTGAGSTQVQGNNINQTLSADQQKLAGLAGTAAGMFGNVNIPNAENIRNTALQGSQNLLQQAQGFNPQSAAQQEFSALQELYAPQRERDRLALENRLRMQGRLGASENPALRQLEESFRQQDLQGAIQSRNLGFERQQQLQNLSQGMFNQGSQAAKLPTEIQAQRAQIGNAAGMLSQQPFQTANQQAQTANQLAATQSSQGTALANVMATLKDRGLTNQAGLISQAAALQNARDVAALQGLFGGGGNGVSGAINQVGNAASGAVNGLINSGVNAIGGYLGNLFGGSQPYQNPANMGLSSAAVNAMSDDDFIQFLLNGGGTFGTSEGE